MNPHRVTPLAVACLLAGTAACFPVHRTHRGQTDPVDAFLTVGFLVADAVVYHATRPSPPAPSPEPATEIAPPFDREFAREALASIPYKDCGEGGAGALVITFAQEGFVEAVEVKAPSWTTNVAACVRGRFRSARVPPFFGRSHAVMWRVKLPRPEPIGKPIAM